MGKEFRISALQFILGIASTIIISAGGATVTTMVLQARADERAVSTERRVSRVEQAMDQIMPEINTRLSRIEGALGVKK